jgi:hypothetical protein
VTRPRAADDFATIRARMEELRRERAQASKTETHEAEDRGRDTRGLFRRLEGRQVPEPEDSQAEPPSRRHGSGR